MGDGDPAERGRRWWLAWALVAGLVAAACWWLTASLWEPGQTGADRANVLAVAPGVVSAVLSALALWAGVRGARPAPDPDAELAGLARAVATERRRFLDQALGVAWRADPARLAVANPAPGALPAPLESTLLNWQDVDGREVGTIADVAACYRQVASGRLVVLGPPGAGKTVLLSRLVLDLVEAGAEVVPVLLSLPSWDVGPLAGVGSRELAERLELWVAGRLVEDYGLRPGRAARLVRDGRVLPVLDGLDEMDPAGPAPADAAGVAGRPRAGAVIRALNAGDRRPAVVACRHGDYVDITTEPAGRGPVGRLVTDARHVALRPLDPAAIRAYLTDRCHGPDGVLQPRWAPVIAAVERGEPIAEVLGTPWELFLAVTAYGPAGRDPGELLGPPVAVVLTRLLAEFVPAVVAADEDADLRDWDAERCTAWLTTLARHQQRQAREHGRSETDILLPDLWRIADRRWIRWVGPVLAGGPTMAMAVALGVLGGVRAGDRLFLLYGCIVFVIAVTMAIGSAEVSTPASTRLALDRLRHRTGRRDLRKEVARGLGLGLGSGLGLGLLTLLVGGPALGMGIALAFGLASGVVGGLSSGLAADAAAPSATRVVRQSVTYSVTLGLTGALVLGLAGGLLIWRVAGPGLGLVAGLAVGAWGGSTGAIAASNGHVWLRYALGVRSAARRGLLPRRPAMFLDWCLERGLMRMAGNAVQFRHRQHQDWLAAASRTVELPGPAPVAEAVRDGGTVGGGT